jgi:hypothetical protein
MLITNQQLNYLIDGKDKFTFHASHHVTTIRFLIIGIIATSILFAFLLVLNQNHTAMAQVSAKHRSNQSEQKAKSGTS